MKMVRVFVSLLLIATILTVGCATGQPPVPVSSEFAIPSVSGNAVSNPKLVMASYYESEELSVSPSALFYLLPLDLGEIINLRDIEWNISPNHNQKQLLKANDFVVIPWHGDDIVEPYRRLKRTGFPSLLPLVPCFISTTSGSMKY